MTDFKVNRIFGSEYQVLEWKEDWEGQHDWISVYRGNLANCAAYIQLRQNKTVDLSD